MKTYMTAKKKKKKLYQHNFFLSSSWPSNMGCWVLGRRVFEGSCAAQILWRFYDLLGRIYIILSIISLEILSWILGVIESSGRLFFNIPLKKKS
jgi:hypothetical protein